MVVGCASATHHSTQLLAHSTLLVKGNETLLAVAVRIERALASVQSGDHERLHVIHHLSISWLTCAIPFHHFVLD